MPGIYETVDLSQWIAANPKDVLVTHFGQPAEVFGKFPDRDVFVAGKDGGPIGGRGSIKTLTEVAGASVLGCVAPI